MKNWNPPDHWLKITSIDAHTAGEPIRVITGGLPELPGDTILARRRYMKDQLDHLSTAVMSASLPKAKSTAAPPALVSVGAWPFTMPVKR